MCAKAPAGCEARGLQSASERCWTVEVLIQSDTVWTAVTTPHINTEPIDSHHGMILSLKTARQPHTAMMMLMAGTAPWRLSWAQLQWNERKWFVGMWKYIERDTAFSLSWELLSGWDLAHVTDNYTTKSAERWCAAVVRHLWWKRPESGLSPTATVLKTNSKITNLKRKKSWLEELKGPTCENSPLSLVKSPTISTLSPM